MRYISHYREYPIHISTEGGYYSTGNELIGSERKSKRQCRKEFEKIWQDCFLENEMNGFTKDKSEEEWHEIQMKRKVNPWIRLNANEICRFSRYTGESESYIIERKQGSQEKDEAFYY